MLAQSCYNTWLFTAKIRGDHLVLLAAKSHPFARRKILRTNELAGLDLILRERGSITCELIQTMLMAANIRTTQMLYVAMRWRPDLELARSFPARPGRYAVVNDRASRQKILRLAIT